MRTLWTCGCVVLLVLAVANLPVGLRAGEAEEARKLGVNLVNQRKCREALKWLDKALNLRPDDDRALQARACAWIDLGRFDKALEDVNDALRLNPQNSSAHNTRGGICHHFGRDGQAIACYDRALTLESNMQYAEIVRKNRAKSIRDREDTLHGRLRPPAGDLPKLAREAKAQGPRRVLASTRPSRGLRNEHRDAQR